MEIPSGTGFGCTPLPGTYEETEVQGNVELLREAINSQNWEAIEVVTTPHTALLLAETLRERVSVGFYEIGD